MGKKKNWETKVSNVHTRRPAPCYREFCAFQENLGVCGAANARPAGIVSSLGFRMLGHRSLVFVIGFSHFRWPVVKVPLRPAVGVAERHVGVAERRVEVADPVLGLLASAERTEAGTLATPLLRVVADPA